MPTYLYFCETHGEFEEIHSISTQLDECPKCKAEGIKSEPPKRLIAPGSTFILSGSGWANTGYS